MTFISDKPQQNNNRKSNNNICIVENKNKNTNKS